MRSCLMSPVRQCLAGTAYAGHAGVALCTPNGLTWRPACSNRLSLKTSKPCCHSCRQHILTWSWRAQSRRF